MVPPIRLALVRGSAGRSGSKLAGSTASSVFSEVTGAVEVGVTEDGATTDWEASACPKAADPRADPRIEPVRMPPASMENNRSIDLRSPHPVIFQRRHWMPVWAVR